MQHSRISKYAQQDIQRVLEFLGSTGQGTGKLLAAIQSDSPILEKHLVAVLSDGDYTTATPSIKRIVGMLMGYADRLAQGETSGYPRANQAEAVGAANRKQGRVSVVSRVSLPERLEQWWQDLTPEERGDFLAGAYHPETWAE